MKKVIRLLSLCLALVLLLCTGSALAYQNEERWVKTANGGKLNVRAEANKDSQILGQIPYGQEMLVKGFNENKTWAYIETEKPAGCKVEGVTLVGWVMTSMTSTKKPGPAPTPSPDGPAFSSINAAAKAIKYLDEPYDAIIITKNPANYVHLRWFPTTEANYIEKYLCNTCVTVIAQSKDWVQVIVPSEDGPQYVGFILRANVAPLADD